MTTCIRDPQELPFSGRPCGPEQNRKERAGHTAEQHVRSCLPQKTMTDSILYALGTGTISTLIFILSIALLINLHKADGMDDTVTLTAMFLILAMACIPLFFGIPGEPEGQIQEVDKESLMAARIFAAESMLTLILYMAGRKLVKKAEYLHYIKKYKRIRREIEDILSEKGVIEIEDRKMSTGVACLPDGRIRTVNFGRAAGDWLLQEAVGTNICPSVRAEDILKSPDAVILKSGKYRSDAAKRIVRRAEKKCEKIKEDIGSSLWMNNRSIIYVNKEGKVRRVVFDLPVSTLFQRLAGEDTFKPDLKIYLASEEEILSAAEKEPSG